MSEDTGLRLKLVRELIRMKYGEWRALDGKLARQAWPATGDYDNSLANQFMSIALAVYGHRPISSHTTEERIVRDLDGSFKVEYDLFGDAFYIKRLVENCPKCRGSGTTHVPLKATPRYIEAAAVPTDSTVTDRKPCDHTPAR